MDHHNPVWYLLYLLGVIDLFRSYFKQAREELAVRLCDRVFDVDGSKNKWWQVQILLYIRTNAVHVLVLNNQLFFTLRRLSPKRNLWARS